MKLLVIGGGGREHALCWKLAQSPQVEKLFCAPGNAGISKVAECVDLTVDDLDKLARFALRQSIDLTVVGPEAPLAAGIANRFERDGLRVLGPTQRAARLEGSKAFCKLFMRRHGIPTAEFQTFDDPERARTYIIERGAPIVVKADGLAAGKGVIVAATVDEALTAVDRIMVKRAFGEAGKTVVIEEALKGEEASIIALTDGKTILPFPTSQDHKRVFDNDQGPNTGGMGAYSPAPVVTDEVMDRVIRDVLVPTVHGMKKEGSPFRGVLYAGLMITESGPKVLEYNVRFGDPETQPLMMRARGDLVDVFMRAASGDLADATLDFDPRPAVCVVMAAGGYPEKYEKGRPITGLDEAAKLPDVQVFHAATKTSANGNVITDGGRVLGVTALGKDVPDAIRRAYEGVGKIKWEGAHYRKDIGAKAMARV
jgi:phosphoribosylamine---glycine ligase